jgi:Pyridoxamine 5'-phosphate oxidase
MNVHAKARKGGAPSERVRVKRLYERGAYDRETVNAILDSWPIAHVGYVFDGHPYVTPTLQWREGDEVFWHGSSASRMLESCEEAEVCLTVTMKLDEASAKVRKGQPIDDEEDYALPIWAGVIPVELKVLDAIADPRNLPGVGMPAHVKDFDRRFAGQASE